MKLNKPSHATVVAYLALFAALGGTAIAARDNLGAKELKPLVVRKARVHPDGRRRRCFGSDPMSQQASSSFPAPGGGTRRRWRRHVSRDVVSRR